MKKSECCQKKKEEKFFSAELDPTRGFDAGVTPQEVFNAFFSGEGLGQNVYMAMAAGAPSSIYQRYYQYAQQVRAFTKCLKDFLVYTSRLEESK